MCHRAILVLVAAFLLIGCSTTKGDKGHMFPLLNAKVSYPQTISVEAGLSYDPSRSNNDATSGPFVSYEPGINGQKVHIGYSHLEVEGLFEMTLKSWRASVTYMNAWRDTNAIDKGDNLFGVELLGAYNIFVISGGGFYNARSKEVLGTVGIGIGW